jgi:23S rRNA (adenine2503-C2)-methyltransferase
MKRLLYDLDYEELVEWMKARGQAGYRAGQVFKWAYGRNAASFEQMSDLPQGLRQALEEAFTVGPLAPQRVSTGADTVKLLVEYPEPPGGRVECVRIGMGKTLTACLSTQVGCNVRCAFCATGQLRCRRHLTVGEILQQIISLRAHPPGPGEQAPTDAEGVLHISNVVFMGMGEPFHNYEHTVAAVRRLTDKRAFGMSPSRITVSTSGVVPMIRRYAREGLHTELTVSLNAPNDEMRGKLMPGVAKWPLAELLAACKEYSQATGGQPVTFAYVLIDGTNDLLDHARDVAKILRHQPHHLNVIPLNTIGHANLKAPSKERVRAFVEHCRKFGLNVSLRKSKGGEIDAACGQLTTG